MIPYGRQYIDEDDIQAVVDVLRSDWLTTGPKVVEFEEAVADYVNAKYAVAVSSGTAALHCAMYALGIGPGDEVIVPSMTFAATANCIVYQGGVPIFVDVDPDTLLIDPKKVEVRITSKTKAIIGVDYAGHPCDWDALRAIADHNGLALVADGCHALGASYKERKVGTLADLTVFSFHPVKHITTGEGGMVVTDNGELAEKMRIFRNHGINTDHRQREALCSWYYEVQDLGFNYRISDFQCALGLSQLKKNPRWLRLRKDIASRYDEAFAEEGDTFPLAVTGNVFHAYHLYVVRLGPEKDRSRFFQKMRQSGVGVNVHYIPVHFHPFYRERFGAGPGMCPVAEEAYEHIISLPMFPDIKREDLGFVISSARQCLKEL